MKNVSGKFFGFLLGKNNFSGANNSEQKDSQLTDKVSSVEQSTALQNEKSSSCQHSEIDQTTNAISGKQFLCRQTNTANVACSQDDLESATDNKVLKTAINNELYSSFRGLMDKMKDIDVDMPPGLAGDMCKDIARGERRRLPTLRPAAVLAILSALSRNRLNSDGEKMTFFAMATALSASGKEAHQRYIKDILTTLNLQGMLCGKPRSDKNIMLDLYEHKDILYSIDEGHELFDKALSSTSNSCESGMGDLLLELKTSSLYTLSGNHARELSAPIIKSLKLLKDKSTVSDKDTQNIQDLEIRLSHIQNGMPHPFVSLISYSTPIKADFIVNLETILSGFVGRFYYWRGPDVRGKLLKKLESSSPCEDIIERCDRINGLDYQIEMSPDCDELMDQIVDYFEQDEMLNHEQLGAIYARGSEQIKQVASLLAVETGEISSEMLLYSTRIFIDNVNCYMEVLNKKLEHDENQVFDSVEKIVLNVSEKYGPVKKGFMANQIDKRNATVRKARKEKDSKYHYQLIDRLIESGLIVEVDGKLLHSKLSDVRDAA
ncbi:hypothetical protein [Colwellia sp. RSH04]|uniref:hypothetical protein n=1 Tax=Colwellia sp. RSH04 TaxID=2305464 RepID=UPI000E589B7E|nr:hypothetical protein [Colwellia sp. RSH04]RHW76460.1 hypothetical protein D1094_09120 [Colwellia sp. RSH04]